MTCGTPASTGPTVATCRSSAIRPAFRSRSPTSSPARPPTSPPPASTASSARPPPRVTGVLGALHAAAALLGLPALADKGYDGAGIGVHTPAKGGNLAPST